ncbi:MAG: DUF554 domain-containing protein [Bacteroidales bacterium]|nr:DUF554 domain-containing protein [Bacteroidales bacterium]MCL2133688.1 DUF554 domain-containing protein [Bacteroidales bacterium]
MFGTIANAAAIIAGSALGLLIHTRLPQKYVNIIFQGMGLFTIVIGMSMALKAEQMILVLLSIVAGSFIGEALNIEGNLEKATNYLLKKVKKNSSSDNSISPFSLKGFIIASMFFCVGSMAILGSFEDGLGNPPQLLYTKSVMDGIISIALAASFGFAVAFSAIPVFIYQGTLTLLAACIMRFMSDTMITDLTAVGGVLLIGLGISILQIKEIKIANMLPSLAVIILLNLL